MKVKGFYKKIVAVVVILAVCGPFAYFGTVQPKTVSALTLTDSGCKWQEIKQNNGKDEGILKT